MHLSDAISFVKREINLPSSEWREKTPGKDAPIAKLLTHLCICFPENQSLRSLSVEAHRLGLNKYHGKQIIEAKENFNPVIDLILSIPLKERKSVLEVGCGNGQLLTDLINLQIFESAACIEHPSMKDHFNGKQNFITEFSDLNATNSFNCLKNNPIFSLVICTEVAEHLTPESHNNLVNLCTQKSDTVLFSSPPEGVRSSGHISCRNPEYWTELFESRGFCSFIPPLTGEKTGKQFFVFSSNSELELNRGYDLNFYNQTCIRDDQFFAQFLWRELISYANPKNSAYPCEEAMERIWTAAFLYPSVKRHFSALPWDEETRFKAAKIMEQKIPDIFFNIEMWVKGPF